MKRSLRYAVSSPTVLLATVVFSHTVTGCGGEGKTDCTLDPPGKSFTFHVHNGGVMMLRLTYGCNATLPVELDTPEGQLSIGPGAVNTCEVTCDSVYAGHPNNGCSDCGPVLTVCADAMMGAGAGYCATVDESKVSFTIDTTADQGTIEVP